MISSKQEKLAVSKPVESSTISSSSSSSSEPSRSSPQKCAMTSLQRATSSWVSKPLPSRRAVGRLPAAGLPCPERQFSRARDTSRIDRLDQGPPDSCRWLFGTTLRHLAPGAPMSFDLMRCKESRRRPVLEPYGSASSRSFHHPSW